MSGDAKTDNWNVTARSFSYAEIEKKCRGPMYAFTAASSSSSSSSRDKKRSNGNVDSGNSLNSDICGDSSSSMKRPCILTVDDKNDGNDTSLAMASIDDSCNKGSCSASDRWTWTCSVCTYINTEYSVNTKKWRDACEICDSKRDGAQGKHET